MVKLFRQSSSCDVFCIQPYQVADGDLRCRESAAIGRHLVLGLSNCDLIATVGMEIR